MRTIGVFLLLLAFPLTAAAQPGMTPSGGDPYAPPPPGPVVTPEPKVNFDIGLIAASPKGDWNQEGQGVQTSPGFQLSLGFKVASSLSLFGGLRFIRVQFDESVDAGFQNIEMTHRELQLGLRYTSAMSGSTKVFLEGNIHSAAVAVDFEGQSDSTTGTGIGVRGGLIFAVDRKIGIGAAIGYSSSTFSENETDFDDAWLSGDAFISFGF